MTTAGITERIEQLERCLPVLLETLCRVEARLDEQAQPAEPPDRERQHLRLVADSEAN